MWGHTTVTRNIDLNQTKKKLEIFHTITGKLFWILYEPQQDKTNKMTCVPSKDSDQPGHPPSLIRVFAVHFMSN